MKSICFLLIITILNINLLGQIIDVPKGASPQIDGEIQSSEWIDAVDYELYAGEELKFKYDDSHLYVSIKGKKGGFSSIALQINDEILILHSSTRLITAKYKMTDNGVWRLTSEFRALSGSKRNKRVNEAKQLDEFGWHANLVGEGPPEESEFKISRALLNDEINLSVVFYQVKAKNKFAVAPKNLNDASVNKELVVGGNVEFLKFTPKDWLKLRIK